MPKFTVSIPGGRIGNFLAGAVVASVIGGTAVAITSPDFTYSTTKTGYFTIDPMAMIPDRSTAEYFMDYGGSLTSTTSTCYSAGVNLPQGSRITGLVIWYKSPNTSNPSTFFACHNLTDGSFTALVPTSPILDDTNTRKTVTFSIPGGSPVSNIGFTYGFGFCPGAAGVFYGARIAYTYTSAGD